MSVSKEKPCCGAMADQLSGNCPDHGTECLDLLVGKDSAGRFVLRAANATYDVAFCPWCGRKIQDLDWDLEVFPE